MNSSKVDPRIIEQFNKRAPFLWSEATVLVLSHVGSHSHGTYIPKDDPQAVDDIDYMGVIIPPIDFTFGLREWDNLSFQYEELDCVFYSFKKFIGLLMKNNPNVIGLLWMRDEFIFEKSHLWDLIVGHRDDFSSLISYASFVGYGKSQFDKMTSFDLAAQREWDDALAVIEAAGWTKEQIVTSGHRGMPDWDGVDTLIQKWQKEAGPKVTIETDLVKVVHDAEATVRKIHAKHFQGYMGEKRKALVRKYQYDTKNAAHLIRLMRMCCEFLETGVMNVYRTTDAEELKGIKQGAWTLDRVKLEAGYLFKRAEVARANSTLPDKPDFTKANNLVKNILLQAYGLW